MIQCHFLPKSTVIFNLLSTQVFYIRLKRLMVLKVFSDINIVVGIIWKHNCNILKY